MFEQSKGASQGQASNSPSGALAALFQNAGSFQPGPVSMPTISAPQAGMPSSKGTADVNPTATPLAPITAPTQPIMAPSPQQAAAATAARMQERTPPVAASSIPSTPMERLRELMKSGQGSHVITRRGHR